MLVMGERKEPHLKDGTWQSIRGVRETLEGKKKKKKESAMGGSKKTEETEREQWKKSVNVGANRRRAARERERDRWYKTRVPNYKIQ